LSDDKRKDEEKKGRGTGVKKKKRGRKVVRRFWAEPKGKGGREKKTWKKKVRTIPFIRVMGEGRRERLF